MFKFWLYSVLLVTVVAMIQVVRSVPDGRVYTRKTKRNIIDNNSVYPVFLGFDSSNDDESKPEFITSFDMYRLLSRNYAMKQFHCVVNENQCDSTGMRIKASVAEALNRNCNRCTPTERKNIQRMINYVKKHYPELWLRVEPIYREN